MSKLKRLDALVASGGLFAGVLGAQYAEGAVVSLTASPTSISYGPLGNGANVSLQPLGATFFQYNDNVGKTLYPNGGFQWKAVNQGDRIDKNMVFSGILGLSTNASGTRIFAFKQGSYFGWIKENLGGAGGTINILAAAYNNNGDLLNDYIFAGTLNGGTDGGGGGAVPEPATAAIFGLAALAMGAKGLRSRRRNKSVSAA